MASKKCINIFITNYFMAVRKCIITYIPNIFVLLEVLSMIWSHEINPSSILQRFDQLVREVTEIDGNITPS